MISIAIIVLCGCTNQTSLKSNDDPNLVVMRYMQYIANRNYDEAAKLLTYQGQDINLKQEIENKNLNRYLVKMKINNSIVNGNKSKVFLVTDDKTTHYYSLILSHGKWKIENPVPLTEKLFSYRAFSSSRSNNWEIKRIISVSKLNDGFEVDRQLIYKYIGLNSPKSYKYLSNYDEQNNPNLSDPYPINDHVTGISLNQKEPLKYEDAINELNNYKIHFEWDGNKQELNFINNPVYVFYYPYD